MKKQSNPAPPDGVEKPAPPRLSESTRTIRFSGLPIDDKLVLARVKQIATEWRSTTLTDGGRFQDFLFIKLSCKVESKKQIKNCAS